MSTSFVDQQLGDSNNLSRSAFSLADYDRYNAYASVAAPGNYTHATPWATSPPNDHAFGPFGNTLGVGFTADAADHDGTTLSTALDPYTWGTAAPAAYSNHNTFAPAVNSNSSSLTGSSFAANTAYNGDIVYPTAPNAYTGSAAAPQGPMNHYMGADLHYPAPGFPIMDPFAADTNGIGYHGQFPTANGLSTQFGAAIEPPNSSHSTHHSEFAPFNLAQQPPPPPRPTCPTCNRSFGRQADLHRHAKIHRADAKVFRCACCGYRNYRKDKLDEHVKRSGHQAAAAAGMSLGGV